MNIVFVDGVLWRAYVAHKTFIADKIMTKDSIKKKHTIQ